MMAGPITFLDAADGGPERLTAFGSNVRPGQVFLAVNDPREGTESIRLSAADAVALGVALIRAAGSED